MNFQMMLLSAMSRSLAILSFLICSSVFIAIGQDHWQPSSKQEVPPKPNHLVDDLAGMLTPDEADRLERKLVAESDSTSTQIAILTIESLNGYEIAQLAFKIGDAWGIGGPNQDNGVLILVSKNDRSVFIATGKGMEGSVPDVTAKRIVDNIIVPSFRNGDYYKGLDEATDAIIKLAAGEFVDELENKGPEKIPLGLIIVIIIIILLIISRINRGGRGGYIGRRGFRPSPWFWGGLGGGFGSGGGFGGGGGGFSGGGGFGGFGGGSFGGGGAGGRW